MDRQKIESLVVPGSTSIKQAIQKINDTAEKILFVAGPGGALEGTLTDGDVRRGIINGIPLTEKVGAIMNRGFFFIGRGVRDKRKEAVSLMQKHHIDHVPVLDEAGLIEDVISWVDCLTAGNAAPRAAGDLSGHPVVVMAGGKGTRLDPFTRIIPKPLIPLGEKPIIEHIMDRYHRNGFSRFILVVNYKKEIIKSYFGECETPYSVEFVEEGEYMGTAGGLALLGGMLDDTFVVTNCDTILEGDYADFFNWHRQRRNVLTVVGSHKEIQVPYGVLNMDSGSLSGIDEKPKIDIFINTGTYVLEPRVLERIGRAERIDMDRLIARVMSEGGGAVGVYPHWGGWFDIGQWDEYRRSLKMMGGPPNEL